MFFSSVNFHADLQFAEKVFTILNFSSKVLVYFLWELGFQHLPHNMTEECEFFFPIGPEELSAMVDSSKNFSLSDMFCL